MVIKHAIFAVFFVSIGQAVRVETGLNSLTDYATAVYKSFYKNHCNNEGMGPIEDGIVMSYFMDLPFPVVMNYTVGMRGDYCSVQRMGDVQIINGKDSDVQIQLGFSFDLNLSLTNVTINADRSVGTDKFHMDVGNIVMSNSVKVNFNNIVFIFPDFPRPCSSAYHIYITMNDFNFKFDNGSNLDLQKWFNDHKPPVLEQFIRYVIPSDPPQLMNLCEPSYRFHYNN